MRSKKTLERISRSEPLTRRNLAALDCATLSLKGRGWHRRCRPRNVIATGDILRFICSMSEPTADIASPPSRALRIVLSLLAALESVLALSDLPGALSWHDAGFSVGQLLINANLVVHPLFALAALALAVSGRLRAALIVLAAYVLVDWLSEVPTLLRFGFEGNFTSVGISIFGQQVVFPLLAIAAIVLAAKNMRLWLAALFVALPPLNLVLGIVIFTVSVLLYGF